MYVNIIVKYLSEKRNLRDDNKLKPLPLGKQVFKDLVAVSFDSENKNIKEWKIKDVNS